MFSSRTSPYCTENLPNASKSTSRSIELMGNPCVETSSDLLVHDTKEIASEFVETVMEIEKAGQEQFDLFIEE